MAILMMNAPPREARDDRETRDTRDDRDDRDDRDHEAARKAAVACRAPAPRRHRARLPGCLPVGGRKLEF